MFRLREPIRWILAVGVFSSAAALRVGASALEGLDAQCLNAQQQLCSSEGLLEMLHVIRRICVSGDCQIPPDINEKVDTATILGASCRLPHTTFFFDRAKHELPPHVRTSKETELEAILGPFITKRDNTAVFVIGKASATKDTRESDRALSSKRADFVRRLVNRVIKKNAEIAPCDKQIFYAYVG